MTKVTHSFVCLDYDPLKSLIATANAEDYIATHEINETTGDITLLKKRTIPSKGISCMYIRPDKKLLIAGAWDCTIRLFSWLKPEVLKPLGALKFHEKAVESLAFSDKLFAAGSSDGYITIWKVYQ